MEFGWINLWGACIVVLIMIPNILYACAMRGSKDNSEQAAIPRLLSVCEQIGRFGCIVLMWLPVFVWKFGFASVYDFIAWLLLNIACLLAYYIVWGMYCKKKTLAKAMALAVIPTAIFLLSGFLLHHWCLVVFALLFGYAHCRITFQTHCSLSEQGVSSQKTMRMQKEKKQSTKSETIEALHKSKKIKAII